METNFGDGKDWIFMYVDHPKQQDSVSCGVFCLRVNLTLLHLNFLIIIIRYILVLNSLSAMKMKLVV